MSDGERRLSLERLWVLMVTAFVDMIGFALIMPLLPYYATRFGAKPAVVGALTAAFAFAQLLSAPLWGRLSDRAGRRPIIVGGQCLSALAFLAFAAADSVAMLLVCRLLQGAGGGALSATVAYVSDSVGPDERAKALGWITAATSAGVMVGPAIASATVTLSPHAPGLVAAGFCFLNILFAWRWLPESSSAATRAEKRRPLREAIGAVLRHPLSPVSTLLWIYTAGMTAFLGMSAVFALFVADSYGITERTIGYFYVAVGATSVVMRAGFLGIIVKRWGEVRTLRAGAVCIGTGMLLAPLAPDPYRFLAGAMLISTGTALLFPSTTSLVSRHADPKEVGQLLGVQASFGGLSRLVGPLAAGALYQEVGRQVPFFAGGVLVFAVALFALRLRPGEAPKAVGVVVGEE